MRYDVTGFEGITEEERAMVGILRKAKKPFVYEGNKALYPGSKNTPPKTKLSARKKVLRPDEMKNENFSNQGKSDMDMENYNQPQKLTEKANEATKRAKKYPNSAEHRKASSAHYNAAILYHPSSKEYKRHIIMSTRHRNKALGKGRDMDIDDAARYIKKLAETRDPMELKETALRGTSRRKAYIAARATAHRMGKRAGGKKEGFPMRQIGRVYKKVVEGALKSPEELRLARRRAYELLSPGTKDKDFYNTFYERGGEAPALIAKDHDAADNDYGKDTFPAPAHVKGWQPNTPTVRPTDKFYQD